MFSYIFLLSTLSPFLDPYIRMDFLKISILSKLSTTLLFNSEVDFYMIGPRTLYIYEGV